MTRRDVSGTARRAPVAWVPWAAALLVSTAAFALLPLLAPSNLEEESAALLLGIIVGVASVTAVIAALTGLKTKVLTEFESVGAARLYVFPNRPDNVPR